MKFSFLPKMLAKCGLLSHPHAHPARSRLSFPNIVGESSVLAIVVTFIFLPEIVVTPFGLRLRPRGRAKTSPRGRPVLHLRYRRDSFQDKLHVKVKRLPLARTHNIPFSRVVFFVGVPLYSQLSRRECGEAGESPASLTVLETPPLLLTVLAKRLGGMSR